MNKSKITTEDAPQYQKDLKNFVDSMTEDGWRGDENKEDKKAVDVEEKWLQDFVDSMDPEDFDNRKD